MFAWKKLFVTSPQTDNCVAIVKKKHYAQAKDTRISVSQIVKQTKPKIINGKLRNGKSNQIHHAVPLQNMKLR